MRRYVGDVWCISKPEDDIVVPTNIGWRTNGEAVMGAGLAKQAARYYPPLLQWYGEICSNCGSSTPVVRYGPLILFPTKPLNESQPYMSWQSPSSVDLICRALDELSRIDRRNDTGLIFVPPLGCGHGGLSLDDVLPLIECALGYDDRFVLIGRR